MRPMFAPGTGRRPPRNGAVKGVSVVGQKVTLDSEYAGRRLVHTKAANLKPVEEPRELS